MFVLYFCASVMYYPIYQHQFEIPLGVIVLFVLHFVNYFTYMAVTGKLQNIVLTGQEKIQNYQAVYCWLQEKSEA